MIQISHIDKMNSLKFIMIGLVAFFLTYYFLVVPKLVLDISSNTSGESHIFYQFDKNGNYSGTFSKNKDIKNGRQTIKYKLQSYNNKLRWDPVEKPFNIEIHQIYINLSGFKLPISFDKISGTNQIQSIISKDEKIIITSTLLANDPQLFFSVDSEKINLYRIVLSITYTLVFLMIINLFLLYKSKLTLIINNIDKKMDDLLSRIDISAFDFKVLGILTVISIFLHIFEISNFMISIDDELSALRVEPEIWIWDGRWTGYLLEAFIFPQPTMPYIPNLISCFLIALSFMLIIRSHNLQSDWRIYITYPIFAVFPTLWFINEFYGNVIMVAFGFFTTSLSVYILSREDVISSKLLSSKFAQSLLISSILLAISMGAYQSFIMLFIAMGIGSIIARDILFENEKMVSIFSFLSKLTIILFFGVIFYVLIDISFHYLFPSTGRGYIDSFWRLNELFQTPFDILIKVVDQMYKFYFGCAGKYGISIFGLGLLFILSFFVLIFKKIFIPTYQLIGLWTIVLFSPFLLHFLTGANNLPTRSMVALPYVVWMMSIIILSFNQRFRLLLAIIIIILVNIQIFSTNGQYAASSNLTQMHDRMLAEDLYQRIAEANPNFDRTKESVIDVYGWLDYRTLYPAPATSTSQGSFFNWNQGEIGRMLAFMQLLGYENLKTADSSMKKTFHNEFEKMPVWPAKGSVRFVNNVYLIKLGVTPDVSHKD